MSLLLKCVSLAAVAALSLATPATAQTKIKLQEIASGLIHPLAMVSIPDGTGRMAVIEQHGQVRIIDARGRLLPEPFLDIGPKMVTLHHFFDERGLLGIAFHPATRRTASFTSLIPFRCAVKNSTGGCGGRTPTSCPNFK